MSQTGKPSQVPVEQAGFRNRKRKGLLADFPILGWDTDQKKSSARCARAFDDFYRIETRKEIRVITIAQ